MTDFEKHAYGIFGALAIGLVGFVLSVIWGGLTRRRMERDTYVFLAKMWSALALFGILLHFVM